MAHWRAPPGGSSPRWRLPRVPRSTVAWPVVVTAVPRPAVTGIHRAGCLASAAGPGGGLRAPAADFAAVIPRLGVLAAINPGLDVAVVVADGPGARRYLDRDALRKRRIAD